MKNYVPVTLDQYINESKSITLKRGYGAKKPVVVGASAPIRNQVLAYVAEGKRVSSSDLKRFVAGLNETNANPAAAATMWLRRNEKFFIAESKEGRTFYKLSPLGQRLVNRFAPSNMNEGAKTKKDMDGFKSWLADMRKKHSDFDEELGEIKGRNKYVKSLEAAKKKFGLEESSAKVSESKKYDFKDPKTNEPGIVDKDKEETEECGVKESNDLGGKISPKLHNLLKKDQDKDDKEFDGYEEDITKKGVNLGVLTEARRKRIEQIIENIKARNEKALNEEEEEEKEEKEEGSADELSFDDLDLGGEEGKEEGEEKEAEGEEEEKEGEEEKEEGEEEEAEGEEKEEGEEDKVEITEFILTVDDVDAALEELKEKGIDADKVVDPDAEPEEGEEEAYKEDQISVKAEDWDELKGWLEEKGVDVEEMFGGEIEVEEVEDEEGGEEGEGDMDLDLGGEEGEGEGEELDFDLDLEGGEGEDELELDLGDEKEPEVEESLTGFSGTKHEDETNNLIKGAKQVVINYK